MKGIKYITDIDVVPLQRKLAGMPPTMWDPLNPDIHSSKDVWSALLYLCFARISQNPIRKKPRSAMKWVPREAWTKPPLQPFWTEYSKFFEVEMSVVNQIVRQRYGGILRSYFAALGPGAIIPEHTGLYTSSGYNGAPFHVQRLHLPIVTDRKVEFYMDNELCFMDEGKLYEFDELYSHRVENKGELWRIHLIMDVIGQK